LHHVVAQNDLKNKFYFILFYLSNNIKLIKKIKKLKIKKNKNQGVTPLAKLGWPDHPFHHGVVAPATKKFKTH
jgi:hypothetical protein